MGTKDDGACLQIAFSQKVYSFLCVCVCNVVLSSFLYLPLPVHSMSYNTHLTLLHIFNFELGSSLGKYWLLRNNATLQCVVEKGRGAEKEEHPDGFVIAFLGSQFSGKTTNDWRMPV